MIRGTSPTFQVISNIHRFHWFYWRCFLPLPTMSQNKGNEVRSTYPSNLPAFVVLELKLRTEDFVEFPFPFICFMSFSLFGMEFTSFLVLSDEILFHSSTVLWRRYIQFMWQNSRCGPLSTTSTQTSQTSSILWRGYKWFLSNCV